MKRTTGTERLHITLLDDHHLVVNKYFPASAQDQGTKESGPPLRYTLTTWVRWAEPLAKLSV